MKSLKDTEPTYTKCEATDKGWVDIKTGELIVAIKDLKTRLGDDTTKRKRGRPKKNG